MPSFDIVSEIDKHELDNAVQQTRREIETRFDFKGTDASIEQTEEGLVLRANSEGRVDGTYSVLQDKVLRRKLSLKILDPQKVQPAGGQMYRQLVKLREGIATEKAKEIVKIIKDSKLKVQASIQGETVRVTGKKRDDLQAVIAMLKEKDLELPLQYKNFRD
ncbi:MAG: YajQ family cyclic di-GMP-binding protein [Sandaracinaceae bacterium]|nr:YajQ family cyclic di-GMP-binding protein [Sandaracinaceae bacterium]